MKLLKPVYDAATKIYTCDVQNGIRRMKTKEGDTWAPSSTETTHTELITWLITSTQGWFTKPITEEWLSSRLEEVFEFTKIPEQFDGTVEWSVSRVCITKERFFIHWSIESIKEAPKVVIEFEEEQPEEVVSLPDANERSEEILAIGPTRRVLHKHKVLQARVKAARALFKAERMTQDYIQAYGEDTDWEDEDSGNESP